MVFYATYIWLEFMLNEGTFKYTIQGSYGISSELTILFLESMIFYETNLCSLAPQKKRVRKNRGKNNCLNTS